MSLFLLDNFVRGLFASIYHAQLIAGYLSNKKSVIKKICGLLLSRSWLARLARIWRGLLGIDRFNYSGCISVIVTTRAMQNFIGEYHFTYRHVFVHRIVFELDALYNNRYCYSKFWTITWREKWKTL